MRNWFIFLSLLSGHVQAQNYNFTEPAVSPDGTQLVFCSDEVKNNALFVSDIEGKKKELLVNLELYESAPNWSPDGKRIVFYAMDAEGEGDLYVVNSDGSRLTNVTNGKFPQAQTPLWYDNEQVLFSTGSFPKINIGLITIRGGDFKKLTNVTGINYYPHLYKDKLVYTKLARGQGGIYLKDLKAGTTLRLTESGEAPTFSPDGKTIAFQQKVNGATQIALMDMDGQNLIHITDNQGLSELPDWSPAGDHIYFQQQINGKFEIWVMDNDGNHTRKLIGN